MEALLRWWNLEGKKSKDFNKPFLQNLTGIVLLRYRLTMNALQFIFSFVQT